MSDHIDEDSSQEQGQQPEPSYDQPGEQSQDTGSRSGLRGGRVGIVAVLAAGVILAAVLATGSGGSGAQLSRAQGTSEAQRIGVLLAGIPQSGNALGSPTAPVTLQYFGDLECSTARAFTLGTLPFIIRKWVRSGELRIEYRSLRTVSELDTFGVQQVAALAAGRQDKLWYYLEYFYHEQGPEHSDYVTEHYLSGLARQVPGLKLEPWSHDRHNPQLTAQLIKDEQAALAARLHSTPSFLIGRTGSATFHNLGRFSTSDPADPAAINEAVQQTLHGQPDRGRPVPPIVASVALARPRQHAARIARHYTLPTNTRTRARYISDIKQTPTTRR
jgi:hypothetical protein